MVKNEKEVFLDFLSTLLDECHNLRIIITLSVTLDVLPNKIRPFPQFLDSLKRSDEVKLFLDNCGALEENELLDLIVLDKNYEYHKWTKRDEDRPPHEEVSDELKNRMNELCMFYYSDIKFH